MLQIKWQHVKHCNPDKIIPAAIGLQPMDMSHHCSVQWLLALAMWLNVFEPDTNRWLHEVIFGGLNTALPVKGCLAIRKEWRNVPVLLLDTSIKHNAKHKNNNKLHEMCLAAMTLNYAQKKLHYIADILGWDNLCFYDYCRTFAMVAKSRIPHKQLKLLLGHCCDHTQLTNLTHVSIHCPIDQSAFAAGSRDSELQLHSNSALAAGRRSARLSAPAAPLSVVSNCHMAQLPGSRPPAMQSWQMPSLQVSS